MLLIFTILLRLMGNCHYPQFAEVKLKPEGELTSAKTPRKWGQDHNYAHQYGMTSSLSLSQPHFTASQKSLGFLRQEFTEFCLLASQ